MAIEVKCPNEHLLKISSDLTGHAVRCPRCQAVVIVPQPPSEVSEQAILEFLGPAPMNPLRNEAPGVPPEADMPAERAVLRLRGHLGEFKTCPKCKREARAAYDICPHCNTYFSDWREVLRRMGA